MDMDGWFDDPGNLRPNDIAEGLDRKYWRDVAEEASGTYFDYGEDDEALDVEPEDVLEVLESYDPETEDSLVEEAVRSQIRSNLLNPYLNGEEVPVYAEDAFTKSFPGLEGRYKLVDQGLARSVFRGPVDSDSDKAVYLPNGGLKPDIYESDFQNRMAMVAVSMQNTERMDNFVSDTFQPVVIEDNGRKVPAAVAEFRPLSDVPEERFDEADQVAEDLQEQANSGKIITLYTLEDIENEFVFGDSFREENIRFDTEREEVVAADAGEVNPNVSREEFEQLLEDKYVDLIQSF